MNPQLLKIQQIHFKMTLTHTYVCACITPHIEFIYRGTVQQTCRNVFCTVVTELCLAWR